jgi:hypothetical protein
MGRARGRSACDVHYLEVDFSTPASDGEIPPLYARTLGGTAKAAFVAALHRLERRRGRIP